MCCDEDLSQNLPDAMPDFRRACAGVRLSTHWLARSARSSIDAACRFGLAPTVILVANSAFAQCSHEIRPEFGWTGGFRGHIVHSCLSWSAQPRIRHQYHCWV